jgi:hypothetical protein
MKHMKKDFKITLSRENYTTKPTRYNLIKLKKQSFENIEDFYGKIGGGYGFTSNFYDKDEEFGMGHKTTSNFDYTHLVVLDVDEENSVSPRKFYYRMPQEYRPTYTYTSYRHNPQKNQMKYHLVYIYKDKIITLKQYQEEYDRWVSTIKQTFPDMVFDSACRSGVQYINGTHRKLPFFEEYASNNLFSLSSSHRIDKKEQDINKCPVKHNNIQNEYILSLTGQFKEDLHRMGIKDFIDKYRHIYPYITENQLKYNKDYNGIRYIDLEKDNVEYIKIFRQWSRSKEGKREITRTKQGKRKKTLYVKGLYFRKIWELNGQPLTDEHLVFCLMYELFQYMDYLGFSTEEILNVAKYVQCADLGNLKHKQPKYKIDPSIKYDRNSLQQASAIVRGHRTMEQIAQYYDFSKSIRENQNELQKIGGIPCSRGTLSRFLIWCRNNNNK